MADLNNPRHVAIIMDGNGRWARGRGMLRHLGHRAGIKPVKSCVRFAAEQGIDSLTLFAFSSENFQRPREEVASLMSLFLDALDREVEELDQNNVRLRFVGALERLSERLQSHMETAMRKTASNTGLNLNVAVAYGGRWDVAQAVQKALADGVEADAINESVLERYLSLATVGDPDLLIRTGGEHRVSNFLLWQLAYTELYFTSTFWPDFTPEHFAEALSSFRQRQRRRGRTEAQLRQADAS